MTKSNGRSPSLARQKRLADTADPPVLLAKFDAVARVTLHRPQRHNAYDTRMRDALYEALLAVRDDPEVRALILCGAGPSFCSGGDLTEFGTAPSLVAAREARWRRDVCGLLVSLPKATIAAVHGYAVGGGLELALLCDLCIVADNARLGYPETGLGMIPGLGGTQTTSRLAGLGRTQELVLSGRFLSGREAVEWGLAVACVRETRLLARAQRLAEQVARLPITVIAQSKRAVWSGLDLPLAHSLELERRLARLSFLRNGSVAEKPSKAHPGRQR